MRDKTKIPYWIQKADLSAEDFSAAAYEEAIAAFDNVDWRMENDKRAKLEETAEES